MAEKIALYIKREMRNSTIRPPRILYISDVPVTNLYSGSAMMYNLFEPFERDKLSIYQGEKISEDKQLAEVRYEYHQPIFERLKFTRFSRIYNCVNIFYNYFFTSRKLKKLFKQSDPDVIVTVVHGLLWIVAYKLAKRNKLPLAICIHDDINAHFHINTIEGKFLRRLFNDAYKISYARFCISDLMRTEYRKEMDIDGTVIYPLQRKRLNVQEFPLQNTSGSMTVAYAGTVAVQEYVGMLDELAKALAKYNSKLIIYSGSFPDLLKQNKNIVFKGFVDPEEITSELGKVADVLFVPFSFTGIENKTHLAFPSKIAEYSSLSKPLLVWASEGSAVGQWFSNLPQKPGMSVTSGSNPVMLENAIKELLDPAKRKQFGKNAFNCGQDYFGHERVQNKFSLIVNDVPVTGP